MAEEIKKFYRSRTDRVLFGVCGGLGKYFGVDPILFRLLFVLFFFVGDGAGIIIYMLAVLMIPKEPGEPGAADKNLEGEIEELADKIEGKAKEISREAKLDEQKMSEPGKTLGVAVVLIGLFFLVRQIFPMWWLDTGIFWALAIIGIGFYIIFKK